MWFISIVMTILFIISFPKFSIMFGIVIGIGLLFKKWATRFYFNFCLALIAKVILEELGEKFFIFKAIDEFIKQIAKATLLTKYFGNCVISYDYFVIVAILLTLSDIFISKLYYFIINKKYIVQQSNNKVMKNVPIKENTNKPILNEKENKIKKEKNIFDDLEFDSCPIKKNN